MLGRMASPFRLPNPMPSLRKWTRWRKRALAAIAALILLQVVALSPSLLDVTSSDLTPETLLEDMDGETTLATLVPKGKVPDYSVDGFDFVSTHEGKKQWKIVSNRAFFYQKEGLIHNRVVTAHLYDEEGKTTIITGNEGQYFPDKRELEMFGNVISRFPDGFETRSEYMRYLPDQRRIEVPERFPVSGDSATSEAKARDRMNFTSGGLLYEMNKNLIHLPSKARVVSIDEQGDATTIESDRARIDRTIQRSDFEMLPERPVQERFTKIYQPGTFCQSRTAVLHYGKSKQSHKPSAIDSLVAIEDVLIRDVGKDSGMKYATANRAEFDSAKNTITLRELPQVYQEKDTVTGDVIILHRDTDVVEVDHSNAYSEGQEKTEESQKTEP